MVRIAGWLFIIFGLIFMIIGLNVKMITDNMKKDYVKKTVIITNITPTSNMEKILILF